MQVVVGIISRFDKQQQPEYLMSKRPIGKIFAGKWEFPGGKVKEGETQQQALSRELTEELSIEIYAESFEKMMNIPWHYQDGLEIDLQIYRVKDYAGTPKGAESQYIAWKKHSDLATLDVLAANSGILNALQLPDYYAITGAANSQHEFLHRFKHNLQHYPLIQLRADETSKTYLLRDTAFLSELTELIKASQATVLVNVNCLAEAHITNLAHALTHQLPQGCAGWHLPSWSLAKLDHSSLKRLNALVACSVHNHKEIEQANSLGVNFMCLGSVLATTSHPNRQPLAFQQFAALCSQAKQPVFAIGGMHQQHKSVVKSLGAQGIASITDSWVIAT